MPETAEPPPVVEPLLPNPVIPSDMDVSKGFFNAAMEAETSKTSEPSPDAISEVTPPPPVPEEKPPVETPPPSEEPPVKSRLPEELITGKKPEAAKVDDAIAELDAMVLPKNAKPEQVASFAKLKEQAKKVIEEKVGRIRELETKTTDAAPRAEIEAAQERIKASEAKARELESTIERIAFTESPRFKQFIADETATLAAAKGYFEGTEINPEILEYAARTSGAQRVKILREAGADPELIASVQPYLVQWDNIQRYKSGALENWKVESARMAEHQKAQQAAQLEQRRAEEDKVWTGSVSKFENELVPLRKFEKNDSWNGRSDEIKAKAKAIYNGDGISLDVVADTILKGVAYDALDDVRVALTDELNKLIKENASLKAAKPNGGSIQGSAASTVSDDSLPEGEAAKRRWNAELGRAQTGA